MDSLSHEEHLHLPAYTISEAATYVGVPITTLTAWVRGAAHGKSRRRSQPIIESPAEGLSFINLVEAHALTAIRRVHKVSLQKVRRALMNLPLIKASEAHPLAREEFLSDGLEIFIEHLGSYVAISSGVQAEMRDVLRAFLRRVDYDEQRLATRLYPALKDSVSTDPLAAEDPKPIVIDPFVAFGKPVLAGTGISTFVVGDRFKAGDDPEDLAKDFGCDVAKIIDAIRWELRSADYGHVA